MPSKTISPIYFEKSSTNSLRVPQHFPPYQQRQRASEQETARTLDKAHGRLEKRSITTTVSLTHWLNWPKVSQVIRIRRERILKGVRQVECSYYVTSLPRQRANAAQLLALVRRHWGAIENGLHHVRDTTFDEDRCTIFRGEASENLATLRNLALNWLRSLQTVNFAATIRSFTRKSERLFAKLGYVK